MSDANGKMRIEKKRITKTVRRIKQEIRMAKTNKQTDKKGKKSFFQVGPTLSIVGTGHSSYFLNSLNPVIPFINVTD